MEAFLCTLCPKFYRHRQSLYNHNQMKHRTIFSMEEGVEPEREALRFELPEQDLGPELYDVMLNIKQLAEMMLFHWKSFPFNLPSSITDTQRGESTYDGDGLRSEGIISFKDLFNAPTFDEVEEVARDHKGDVKKLSIKQLEDVRKMGEFEVDSLNFAGQVHRWRLSQLLQKGTIRSQESLLDDSALAMRLLVVTARNRFFHSHFFSVSQSLKSLAKALWQILDILIGMPSANPGDINQKLHMEHTRFLVAELNIQPACKRQWLSYCDYIREKCCNERRRPCELHPPLPPFNFCTPKGQVIDLRLFNRNLMAKCTEILKKILEKESKGWHIKYKDRLITDLKGQDLSYTEITEYVNKSILEEYMKRVFEAATLSDELEAIQPGIGVLLVNQCKSCLNMEKSIENVREKLLSHEEKHRALLIKSFPVGSRIPAWMNERFQEFKEDFIQQNQWCAHEDAIELCRRQNLSQAEYFLHRDLIYMRDREPVLKKELSRVQIPSRVFPFKTFIWQPQNWVVRRHLHGESEVIATVISDQPPSATALRSAEPEDQPTFSVEKHSIRKTSTRFAFWRWFNFCHRVSSWTLNAMFFLGVVVPWCSPCGLRALFSSQPFMPDLELNPINGVLCPKPSSRTHTLLSRLRALWRHVASSRNAFEEKPDTGFLGKSFTRHLNRLWNYVLKGAVGSTLLVAASVPVYLVVSVTSLLLAALTPFWMPFSALVAHLAAVCCYDYDRPVPGNAVLYLCEAVLFRCLIQGCLQPIAAITTAVVLLPFAAAFVMLFGVMKRGFRAVWDSFMFHAVIKKRGRVPCSDGFIARRIAGPGLASNYFYQVKPEQALAAVEARMELHELLAWRDSTAHAIQQPLHHYNDFMLKLLTPFSAGLKDSEGGGVYAALRKETEQLVSLLQREVDSRKQKLNTGLTPDVQSRIKLSARELKVMIAQTAKMLEGFYPERVIERMEQTEEEFWEGKRLEERDWQGLATQLLTEVFSLGFLTPLEQADICFKLEVQHLNLVRYLEMLKSAEFRDDLDVVSTVHTPKGDIDVDAPYLEPYTFNPVKESVKYAGSLFHPANRHLKRRPWKKKTLRLSEIEKLEVPIPMAHPALIAVLIYNRDHDQEAVDLDHSTWPHILHAVLELPYDDESSAAADMHSVELLYETDADVSTPDRTTTNSDPEAIVSHLAEQESAFSEAVVTPTDASVSFPEEEEEDEEALPSTSGLQDIRVVYHENEADTSCVLDVGRRSEEEEEEEEDGEEYSEGEAISLDSSEFSCVGDSRLSNV